MEINQRQFWLTTTGKIAYNMKRFAAVLCLPAVTLSVAISVPAVFVSTQAVAVQKCQDSTGKWYYGDEAAQACGQSEIKVINDAGVEVGTIEEPPTKEALEAKRAAEKKVRMAAAKKEQLRVLQARLLATYESENAILKARDTKLAGIEKQLEANNNFLRRFSKQEKELQSELARVASQKDKDAINKSLEQLRVQKKDYQTANTNKMRERNQVAGKFETILREYRKVLQQRRLN